MLWDQSILNKASNFDFRFLITNLSSPLVTTVMRMIKLPSQRALLWKKRPTTSYLNVLERGSIPRLAGPLFERLDFFVRVRLHFPFSHPNRPNNFLRKASQSGAEVGECEF